MVFLVFLPELVDEFLLNFWGHCDTSVWEKSIVRESSVNWEREKGLALVLYVFVVAFVVCTGVEPCGAQFSNVNSLSFFLIFFL